MQLFSGRSSFKEGRIRLKRLLGELNINELGGQEFDRRIVEWSSSCRNYGDEMF